MLMRMKQSKADQKGFTLIELLIVIGIISILATIAVPKFTSAGDSARGAKLAADLRTIDSAVAIVIAQGETPSVEKVTTMMAAWPVPPTGNFSGPKHTAGGVAVPDDAYSLDSAANNYRALCGTLKAEDI
jgi:prepilin-type N-terminal cleavage/methylation domain-containing protein